MQLWVCRCTCTCLICSGRTQAAWRAITALRAEEGTNVCPLSFSRRRHGVAALMGSSFGNRIGFAVCAALLVAVCITDMFLCLFRPLWRRVWSVRLQSGRAHYVMRSQGMSRLGCLWCAGCSHMAQCRQVVVLQGLHWWQYPHWPWLSIGCSPGDAAACLLDQGTQLCFKPRMCIV
jgi:hypothetical protein